jgi:hypothetical protein
MRRPRFSRMVVGLPHGRASAAALQATAELAEFLQIELLGTFIADASLRALAGLPGRELRIVEREWKPLELAQISRDLEGAIELARTHFAETIGSCAIKTGFDAVAGARALSSLIGANDIVAIIEPGHPCEWIARQFTDLFEAAFRTPAAVLLVPKRLARRSGPVMVTAAAGDDPSLAVALEIAGALKQPLIVATPASASLSADLLVRAKRLGVPVRRINGHETASRAAPVMAAAVGNERLRVAARARIASDAARLFAQLRGVPLLAVGPHATERVANQHDRAGVAVEQC